MASYGLDLQAYAMAKSSLLIPNRFTSLLKFRWVGKGEHDAVRMGRTESTCIVLLFFPTGTQALNQTPPDRNFAMTPAGWDGLSYQDDV